MANKYFEAGAARAGKVQDLFGAIARRYDLINDLQCLGLHRHWKRKLVDLANPQPGERALDLCCGTGDILRRLSRAGARPVGLDFSLPMLQEGKRRRASARRPFQSENPGNSGGRKPAGEIIGLIQGDALSLPFANAQFDIVTVGYGLRNLPRLEKGLEEILRVLRPGGRLVSLDFGKPKSPVWRWFYLSYLRSCVPIFGRLFFGDPEAYSYILESLNHFPAQDELGGLMQSLGYRRARATDLVGGAMAIVYGEKQSE